MNTDTQKIAARFTDTVNRAPGVKLWLLRPLLTLLATNPGLRRAGSNVHGPAAARRAAGRGCCALSAADFAPCSRIHATRAGWRARSAASGAVSSS
ncbi:hypothetical protein NLX86_27030 [Streptomyces sp. A3M-1-3]|uniref:hypothetical protein n=1 Tax=Streptomyces sp. A3M-1-3 TaxID=2962044 RepID=UPI0020B7500E|nr:hypothetical protein [Streptomyces sp. A3M-1-3]MCP3821612.1 hypothetical protein [Streptomyces sp. A3M-1-3]